jgi:hypothetical protein
MSLEQWLQNGWLRRDTATVAEIQQLLEVVDRDIADAQSKGLSPDGQFQHSYDAGLQLCVIPLRACGYRVPKGGGHHKFSIDSLRHTLGGKWGETADYLERCSRLRGQAIYERSGAVSRRDADELTQTVQKLRRDVVDWLNTTCPELVPGQFKRK